MNLLNVNTLNILLKIILEQLTTILTRFSTNISSSLSWFCTTFLFGRKRIFHFGRKSVTKEIQ